MCVRVHKFRKVLDKIGCLPHTHTPCRPSMSSSYSISWGSCVLFSVFESCHVLCHTIVVYYTAYICTFPKALHMLHFPASSKQIHLQTVQHVGTKNLIWFTQLISEGGHSQCLLSSVPHENTCLNFVKDYILPYQENKSPRFDDLKEWSRESTLPITLGTCYVERTKQFHLGLSDHG